MVTTNECSDFSVSWSPDTVTRKRQCSELIFSRSCEKSSEDIENKTAHTHWLQGPAKAFLWLGCRCYASNFPFLGTEMSYRTSPRNGHLGLHSHVFIYKHSRATLIRQHSFILDCVRSGLGKVFFFEGQDRVSTMKFKIPTTESVPFLLIARGPSHGSTSWVL